ncbi:MAG: adenylyl-sulfate kinase [Elusimicrobia bacterium RIFOXYD2_FULL_34_15]|nr:MAG: adenylyl-sulfate kinase [Elusimicrobia bacterium RIFOXYD2_FULL_34_15]
MKNGLIVWLTGLSGSGKSTIANIVIKKLKKANVKVEIVDGDAVRNLTTRHLKYSKSDIFKNNMIISDICEEKRKYLDVIIVTVIAPFKKIRKEIRDRFGKFYKEVYVKASLETVIKRDPKGLYDKVKKGLIQDMIGFSKNVPYEIPDNPDLILDTESKNPKELVSNILDFIICNINLNVK